MVKKVQKHEAQLKLPEPEAYTGQLRGVEAWAPIRLNTNGIEVLDLNCIASTKEKALDRVVAFEYNRPSHDEVTVVQRIAKILIVIHPEEK